MANVLGELFKDQAAAIREGLGDIGTMKPVEFPDRTRDIVAILSEADSLIDEINGEIVNGIPVIFIGADGAELYRIKVSPGKNCADPVTTGAIAVPTKESTNTEYYTYSGWSLTEGGEADPTALNSITEERTVYAAFTASTRYYTVRFYDETTLLQTAKAVYGGAAIYDTPEKHNYIFTGWEPSCENIVADTDCYAQWKVSDKLVDYTWSEIAALSEAGEAAEHFLVGDTKTFEMTVDSTAYTLTARLIGFDHDDLADGSGKAGMTFEIMDMAKVGYTDRMVGSYPSSTAYANFDQNALDYIDTTLSQHIKQVAKKCYSADDDTNTILNAYLWRLSMSELDFDVRDEGEPYKYYDTDGNREESSSSLVYVYDDLIHNDGSTAVEWATRTLLSTENGIWCIRTDGSAYQRHTVLDDTTYAFLLGFCI